MQRSAVQERPGYIQIAQQDYPYLLSYLSEKFGEVRRAGNTFWTTNGRPQMAAVIIAPDQMMLPGKSLLSPETVDIPTLLTALRKRGRLIRVWKQVHFCDQCLAFYTFPEERDSHEHGGGTMHPLRRVGEFSYRRYIPERQPIYRRKGWVSPQLLFSELAEHTGPETAWRLVNLRITALREGKGVTVEELLNHASNPEAIFESVVFERAFAYEDRAAAEAIRIPRRTRTVRPILPTAKMASGKQSVSAMGVIYGEQSFLDWKVKYDGKVLNTDQKLAVALQFGIPFDRKLEVALFGVPLDAMREMQPQSKSELTQTVDAAVKDSIQLGAEEEPQTEAIQPANTKPKTHWRRRRRNAQKPFTSKDARRSENIRHDFPDVVCQPAHGEEEVPGTAAAPAPQSREEKPDEAKLQEDAKKEFFETFNLTQADVLYEQEDGFLKAQKTIFTQLGTRRIEIFNRPLMPQRVVGVGEFDDSLLQIAHELARELGGTVLVTEQRKRGLKSLAVVVKGYTVRVAARPLSSSQTTSKDE